MPVVGGGGGGSCWGEWGWGGGGCCGANCTVTFTVLGCNGIAYPTVPTVNVYDHSGGTLLATGTVNGSGVVALSWSGATGTYWVTITGQSARFAAFASSQSLTCGGSKSLQLAVATGYTCVTGCLYPLANTLTLTDSVIGTCTLTFGGGSWTGSIVYTYPGFTNFGCFCSCLASTVTVNYNFGTALTLGWSFKCNPNAQRACPDDGAGTLRTVATTGVGTSASSTCPTSFNFSETLTLGSCGAANCSLGNTSEALWSLYGGVAGATATITITE